MKTMNFKLLLLSLFTFIAGSLSSQTQLVKDLKAGKERTLIVYGTSITKLGNGPLWVKQVGEELNTKYNNRLTVLNKGGSGRNSEWAANNYADSVLVNKPDAVIIEFSVNDAVTRFDISPEQAVKNTEYLIRKVKEQNSDAEVILLVVSTNPIGEAAEKRPNLAAYIQNYHDLAKKHNLLLIDFAPIWDKMIKEKSIKEMQKYLHDGVHSTKRGALDIIGPTVIKALESGK